MTVEYRYMKISEMDEKAYEKAYFMMSENRKKRVNSCRFTDDRRRTVAADFLLRELASSWLHKRPEDILIMNDRDGAPCIKDEDVFVSISHSGEYAAAVIGDKRVGIDIEKIRKAEDAVIRRICNEKETAYIFDVTGSERDRRFIEVWTFKEAYYKYDNSIDDFTAIGLFECDIRRKTMEIDGHIMTVVYE